MYLLFSIDGVSGKHNSLGVLELLIVETNVEADFVRQVQAW